jgi:acetylornithine deacetylase/succinyl-diaminopimelate desuccinylase-like protein
VTRVIAIDRATGALREGRFADLLGKLVAARSESQAGDRGQLRDFLDNVLHPLLARTGFVARRHEAPNGADGDFLIAERWEADALPTILIYCHGDTVRGDAASWSPGLEPFVLTKRDRRFYGRGTADNKGQLAINLLAIEAAIAARGGHLGFNIRLLAEMGEEIGSPGLHALCAARAAELQADFLLASDGPRLAANIPTLFLGARGAVNVELRMDCRDRPYHSGNWGGLLVNPATVLANAIAALVDARGIIRVAGLRPAPLSAELREAVAKLTLAPETGDPITEIAWGEPGLRQEERLFCWNALEVLAFEAGDVEHPQNAIPPSARAILQLRCVVGTDVADVPAIIQAYLAEAGFDDVAVRLGNFPPMPATRLDMDHPLIAWAAHSIERTLGEAPAIVPNIGGSIPNDAFSAILRLPTIWIPHSYPGCGQHGPDEHMLEDIAAEGLAIMAGIFWDLGDGLGTADLNHRA